MPIIYQQHNNSQIFIQVCIFKIGIPEFDSLSEDEPPSIETFKALVDTGATSSCITEEVANKVGLTPIGQVPIQGVSGTAYHNNYLFHVGFTLDVVGAADGASQGQVTVLRKEITGAEVIANGAFDVLLGMDVLSTGQLVVSGDGSANFSF